jgi:dolichol-phosphate mannosyltransferase
MTARVLVSLATYNERENLPALYAEISRQVPDADVLVIDDNSPDGTGKWCDEQAAFEPRLKCIHRAGKMGLGTATIAAMQYAMDHGYDYLVNLDADFSHPPRYIPTLLSKMESFAGGPRDVMIGSRYVAGGKIEGWPWRRHAMSKLVNCYARTLLKLPVSDCSGAFRCYRVAKLREIDFAKIRSSGYSFQEEILWHLNRAGAQFGETPITFVERQHGQSKINLREAWLALAVIFRLAYGRPA